MPNVSIGTPSKAFKEEHFPFGLIGYGGCQGLLVRSGLEALSFVEQ
jgi:hypothetical protein